MAISPIFANTTEYIAPVEAKTAPRTIDDLINEYSLKYGVSAPLMRQIVKAESSYNPQAVGDKTYFCKRTRQVAPSYGLVQINVCFHDVTIEQAFTPEFAIEFLARHLSQGKCYLWSTCPQVYR